jgi:acyl carrier protein
MFLDAGKKAGFHSMATLFERVRDVVVQQLKVPAADVTPEAILTEDLRADSLDIVDLTIAIEEAFADEAEFEIRDEDAENIRTVQDIIDFLTAQGIS